MVPRFVTLTLNPAVDRSAKVSGLIPSEKLRCTGERLDPGGGGINVARMLKRLGADVVAVFAAGGPSGQLLSQMLNSEALAFQMLSVAGNTRENFSVWDTAKGNQYRFVFPGASLSPDEIEKACSSAVELAGPGGWLVASGSLPPGASVDSYMLLAKKAAAQSIKLALDCAGKALVSALGRHVELVKLNERELADIAGAPVFDRSRAIAAAGQLLETGVRMVAVTRGPRGALLVTPEGAWEASAPPVRALSTVGAGDCFLAVLVWHLAQGHPQMDALRAAVAGGSAALLAEGTSLALPQDIDRLAPQVSVSGQLPLARDA